MQSRIFFPKRLGLLSDVDGSLGFTDNFLRFGLSDYPFFIFRNNFPQERHSTLLIEKRKTRFHSLIFVGSVSLCGTYFPYFGSFSCLEIVCCVIPNYSASSFFTFVFQRAVAPNHRCRGSPERCLSIRLKSSLLNCLNQNVRTSYDTILLSRKNKLIRISLILGGICKEYNVE